MTSAFYESNLQKQRDCLIAETYKSKFFYFLSSVTSIKFCFDQVLFQIKFRLMNCLLSNVVRLTVVASSLTIKNIFIKFTKLDQFTKTWLPGFTEL